ncbi:hypothetical protein ABH930_005515 [Kitasatospora sp. GAS204A]|uniref:hypothetical protein n=1 Tax=unclassified Kitasatospora TaxID=2633591 RepID=UPI002474D843|nr:hypothetical protein [Kitasatospora sp. GAS204B]MDH6121518.1 hypothetical protein [Kitasatospora sp. GAS204B]
MFKTAFRTTFRTATEPDVTDASAVEAAAAGKPKGLAAVTEPVSELRLPVWFFGFEAVFASAFDLFKAFPVVLPLLGVLVVANIALSLTLMRKRLRLARALWRGKETRKVAIGLVALRIGSHFALNAIGVTVTSTAAHVAYAVVLGAITVGLLAFTQETALRALERSRAADAVSVPAAAV